MTNEKLASVLTFYQNFIRDQLVFVPEQSAHYPSHPGHLAWMCQMARDQFIPGGDIAKAHRWLGFVQGCLLCRGEFTLAQLRNHSRSEPEVQT